ncbi:LIM domain-containing protein jub-like [Agrilus planipennis]|uniref:LIM domain-containing protein jub-like n=1 Tax=Agrilus planipennis TaxID=224129 RepID=A0A7F5R5W3_AGRPL|nr:LIM domain-containing protein jub-like [Agrilus planipennis]
MDQSFITKIQNLSMSSRTDLAPQSKSDLQADLHPIKPFHRKQASLDSTEAFSTESSPSHVLNDYTFCEKDMVHSISKEETNPLEENDVYVQCAKPKSAIYKNSDFENSQSFNTPLYENIDYYMNKSQTAPYYHEISGNKEFQKAQPQVPSGNKTNNSNLGIENLSVYENVHELSKVSMNETARQPPPPYSSYPRHQQFYSSKLSNHLCKASPQIPTSKLPIKNLTQQQLDEINASDYVCMTGNISQQFHTSTAKNYERAPATGIAAVPLSPKKEVKKTLEKIESRSSAPPSPTPSSISNTSNSSKLKISGKNLLPYNVTPPRPRGPTEAEKKIEEMTRQIEEEMEKHEEEGEYFVN